MVGRWVGARRRVGGGLSAGAAVRPFSLDRVSGRPSGAVIMDPAVPGAMGGAAAMRETLKLDPAGRGIVSSGYSSDPVMGELPGLRFSRERAGAGSAGGFRPDPAQRDGGGLGGRENARWTTARVALERGCDIVGRMKRWLSIGLLWWVGGFGAIPTGAADGGVRASTAEVRKDVVLSLIHI
jgi:hypothetical protein